MGILPISMSSLVWLAITIIPDYDLMVGSTFMKNLFGLLIFSVFKGSLTTVVLYPQYFTHFLIAIVKVHLFLYRGPKLAVVFVLDFAFLSISLMAFCTLLLLDFMILATLAQSFLFCDITFLIGLMEGVFKFCNLFSSPILGMAFFFQFASFFSYLSGVVWSSDIR